MTTQLQQMIASQPQTLRSVAELDVSPAVAVLRPARRIFVVGTGTSFHAAALGSYLLRSHGVQAEAVTSLEMARWRPAATGEDAVIVISHTGETAYALSVREQALGSGLPLISITGRRAGWGEAITTPTTERSETYTVSYTAALGVLGLLAAGVTGADSGPEAVRRAAGMTERALASSELADVRPPKRALAIVGPGPWSVTARESALKLREGAQVLAEGFDPEGLLHGAAVPFGSDDTLIALAPSDDQDGLTEGMIRAAAATGMSVHQLSAAVDEAREDGALSPAQRFIAQIPATVSLQLLASRFAAERGTDPDTVITGAWAGDELWSAGRPRSR